MGLFLGASPATSIWSPLCPTYRPLSCLRPRGSPPPAFREPVGHPIRVPRGGGVGPARDIDQSSCSYLGYASAARPIRGCAGAFAFVGPRLSASRAAIALSRSAGAVFKLASAATYLALLAAFWLPSGRQSPDTGYRDTVNSVNVPGVSRGLTPATMGASLSAATV